MLDPSAETITVGGVAIPLGDNRILKARFEKYLSQPPEDGDAAREYRATIDEILAAISPFRREGPDLYTAFRMLPSAASYPGDANLCGSLAESIYMAMLSKADIKGLRKLNDSIEQEKKQIILDGDWKARHDRDKNLGATRTTSATDKKGNNGAAQSPGRGVNSLQYADTLRRIAEIEVLKKANIARTEVQTLRTKAQYQVIMAQWFVQRR